MILQLRQGVYLEQDDIYHIHNIHSALVHLHMAQVHGHYVQRDLEDQDHA